MKTTYQSFLLFLAVAVTSALPAPEASVTENVPAKAVHTADAAPTFAPDRNTTLTSEEIVEIEHTVKNCFHITSDNPNWHWSNSGPWGNK